MNKKKIVAKHIAVWSAIFLASHFYSRGFLHFETACRDVARVLYAQTVNKIAVSSGYELREPEERLNISELAEREALRHGLNPGLVRALLKTESSGQQYALSKAGALGLMQVMPSNARVCGLQVAELLDPEKNIRCGTKILAANMRQYDDTLKALMVYNGGPNALKAPKDETVRHAQSVLKYWAKDLG